MFNVEEVQTAVMQTKMQNETKNGQKRLTMKYPQKIIAVFLCVITLQVGMPIPLYAITVDTTIKETSPADFNNFIEQCSMEDRASMMQALKGLDQSLEDRYFGKLEGLAPIDNYATDKNDTSRPRKPETFNDVLPSTVVYAIQKGYLDEDVISRENICKKLIWRRYNKVNYFFHNPNNINYHEDIVQWVAQKREVGYRSNTLSTYDLEREIAESCFVEIWDKLTVEQREELLSKIEESSNSTIANKVAIASMAGGAALAALCTTVAFTGFAFYTTMSVVLCTVAGWVGVTLPFVAYTSAAAGVSAMTGPVGWVVAGGLLVVGGGAAAVAWGWPESETVTSFVLVVNSIKAKYLSDSGISVPPTTP